MSYNNVTDNVRYKYRKQREDDPSKAQYKLMSQFKQACIRDNPPMTTLQAKALEELHGGSSQCGISYDTASEAAQYRSKYVCHTTFQGTEFEGLSSQELPTQAETFALKERLERECEAKSAVGKERGQLFAEYQRKIDKSNRK